MIRTLVATLAVALTFDSARAQTRFTYSSGKSVSPSYEGWMYNDDGSISLYFGYMNSNWEQQFDVPIGPENSIEPGGPDQGQPTHFYPRRNPFLFTVRATKELGTKELVWTLTTNGRTEHAYASLKSDYQIDKQVISTEVGGDFGSLRDELRTNNPPELKVEGEKRRTVRAGEALTLTALAGDPDNLPARRDGKPQPRAANGQMIHEPDAPAKPRPAQAGESSASGANRPNPSNAASAANALYRPPSSIVPSSGPGLRLSWIVYRGNAAAVAFDPVQMKTWTDTRAYANSPWSPPFTIPLPPPNGTWVTKVTFSEPGTYVLRAVASDGALFTYENVTVVVTP